MNFNRIVSEWREHNVTVIQVDVSWMVWGFNKKHGAECEKKQRFTPATVGQYS